MCLIFTVAVAAPLTTQSKNHGNSYLMYIKSLPVDDSGLVELPSRFKWSVETGSSGFDIRGKPLPDPRIMLRLYDPDQPYTTVLTAKMDLATAAKLHHELGDLLVKKLENPDPPITTVLRSQYDANWTLQAELISTAASIN